MIDILAWSFSDWFLAIVICVIALNIFVFGLTFIVENWDVIQHNRNLRKREREAKRTPRRDPEYREVSDWADERLFRATEVDGE